MPNYNREEFLLPDWHSQTLVFSSLVSGRISYKQVLLWDISLKKKMKYFIMNIFSLIMFTFRGSNLSHEICVLKKRCRLSRFLKIFYKIWSLFPWKSPFRLCHWDVGMSFKSIRPCFFFKKKNLHRLFHVFPSLWLSSFNNLSKINFKNVLL